MQQRGHEPEDVAHFLNRVLFCLFAEDVGLLPERILTQLIEGRRGNPQGFAEGLSQLFGEMSGGGHFGAHRIDWFNGGLFTGDDVLEFTGHELRTVAEASDLDWSRVEPAILGTLFERGLDPDKRAQLGAHYTDREKILMVVEPVVMQPLRREFEDMQARIEELAEGRQFAPLTLAGRRRASLPKWEREAEAVHNAFLERLRAVRVLDPACGSGNFLYVTLGLLKDLERNAMRWGAERLRLVGQFPEIDPANMLGIEINPYARELASVSLWIGEIQWMRDNGYAYRTDPVLGALDNIELRDAILARDDEGNPVPAEWPEAEFVVGNPPFLGGKLMRDGLGDDYVVAVFTAWNGVVARESDLICYWHEKARQQVAAARSKRVGLLATNSIRGGANRRVLQRIKGSGDIFMAWSDEPWIVEGAAVRVSIIAQDDGTQGRKSLDGIEVPEIHPDLTGAASQTLDVTQARRLQQNRSTSFMGVTPGGRFDVSGSDARRMLTAVGNPNGCPNSDVVRPYWNGHDVTRRPRDRWIVDFGNHETEAAAARYEAPFAHVEEVVKPARERVQDYSL